nr:YceI family protein [Stenotrophomonas mori]
MPFRRPAALLLACLIPLTAPASERYRLDPVHTRVLFAIDHAGFSQALGTIAGSEGLLEFDPDDWRSARLDVLVPLDRLELGEAGWNRAALARNLLDGRRHPQARFVSTRVEPIAPDHARVHGLLTLRGVSREVVLDTRLNALKRHPLPPFRHTAGFSASATLNRSDFGIDAWSSVIGDRVELRIEAEAVRDARALPPAATGGLPAGTDAGTEDVEAAAAAAVEAALAPSPEPEPRP